MWVKVSTDKKIRQGSIIHGVNFGYGIDRSPLGIVLTDQCDLQNGKCSFLIVAALYDASDRLFNTKEFQNIFQNAENDGEGKKILKKKTVKGFLEKFVTNKNITRFYFIDPRPCIDEFTPGLVVDFQHIISVPYSDDLKFDIYCDLDHPFIEQMMMQFVSYTARIPSNRVTDQVIEQYVNEFAPDHININ